MFYKIPAHKYVKCIIILENLVENIKYFVFDICIKGLCLLRIEKIT